ncbi:MAG: hypothetical protein V4548_01815 [Bacteroidota bacterium]
MEEKDLGSKKINNKQKVNEGFSGENIPKDYNPSKSIMKPELEIDQFGNKKIVNRARNTEKNTTEPTLQNSAKKKNNRGVTDEKDVGKTIENQDFNSDIIPNRNPYSNPDNLGNNNGSD